MAAPRSLVRCRSIRGAIARLGVTAGLCCMAAPALLAPAADTGVVPDDRSISVGCWEVVAVEWDGSPVDRDLLARLRVVYRADGTWTVLLRRFPVAEGTSRNRQDESPKTFEMETLGSAGIEPVRYTGIYRLDGESRVLCMVPGGRPRPDDFAAPRHSQRMLVTLRRTQEPGGGN